MRVHDQNLTGTTAASTGGAAEIQRAGRPAAGTPSTVTRGDRVELSGAAATIARALATDGADRAGRVQQLAAMHQSGTYRPDAGATSRAMVADALGAAMG